MVNLSDDQKAALERARVADQAWRTAKQTAEARIRQAIEAEVETAARDRAVAAYLAHAIGTPKRQIGVYALGSSAPQTYNAAIETGRLAVLALQDAGYNITPQSATPEPIGPTWRIENINLGAGTCDFIGTNGATVPLQIDPKGYLEIARYLSPIPTDIPEPDIHASETEFATQNKAIVAHYNTLLPADQTPAK